jgi:hypothetical protein
MPGIIYISGKTDSMDAGQDSPMHPQSRHTHAPLLKYEKNKAGRELLHHNPNRGAGY